MIDQRCQHKKGVIRWHDCIGPVAAEEVGDGCGWACVDRACCGRGGHGAVLDNRTRAAGNFWRSTRAARWLTASPVSVGGTGGCLRRSPGKPACTVARAWVTCANTPSEQPRLGLERASGRRALPVRAFAWVGGNPRSAAASAGWLYQSRL